MEFCSCSRDSEIIRSLPFICLVSAVIRSFIVPKLLSTLVDKSKSKRKAMNRNWYNQKAKPALNTKAVNK